MAKKTVVKREQPKGQANNNDKKKNQGNDVKNNFKQNRKDLLMTNAEKKKKKYSKQNEKSASEKQSRSFLMQLFVFILRIVFCILLIFGFLYIIDYKNFVRLQHGVGVLLNATLSFLPESVIVYGKPVVYFLQSAGEFVVGNVKYLSSEASAYLSKSPIFKDHWNNIRDISSICSAHVVDYIRTVYFKVTRFIPNYHK